MGLGLAIAYVRAASVSAAEQARWLDEVLSTVDDERERFAFVCALGNLPVVLAKLLAQVLGCTVEEVLGVMVTSLARSKED